MNSCNEHERLKVEFWGVRGSIPTPIQSCLQAGGNTPCIVVRFGAEPPIIVDAGTGLRAFGQQFRPVAANPFQATILFSHFHWDHIQGFPFFSPIYSPHSELQLISGRPVSELQENLARQMREPHFPLAFDQIAAHCAYEQLDRDGIILGSLQVSPIELYHPGRSTGFRIDSPSGSLVYISDHEHGNQEIDSQIVRRSEGADLMIYDSHFTPEEYGKYVGWGHSTWRAGVDLAKAAGVPRFALFHHSPSRTDQQLEEVVLRSKEVFEDSFAACEQSHIWVENTLKVS